MKNSKKTSFLIVNTLIVGITLLIITYVVHLLQGVSFLIVSSLVTLLGMGLYYLLSKSMVDDIFTINDRLKYKIETTLHELNTPVSTIQINSELLQLKLTKNQNLERLNRIDHACDNLIELYEEMEYYIKKEINSVESSSFNLQQAVKYSISQHNDLKKDINISIAVKPIIITTDKRGFTIMLNNLISNAIKHNTQISTIEIELNHTTLTIKDDGEGIKSHHLYSIFDRYFQSDTEHHGFGLGLSIVKEFCDQEKIEIKINSSSKSTVFGLDLVNIMENE